MASVVAETPAHHGSSAPRGTAPPVTPSGHTAPPAPADDEHLRILGLFHYVLAGLSAVAGCGGIVSIVVAAVVIAVPKAMAEQGAEGPPPEVFSIIGWLWAIIGACSMTAMWAAAVVLFLVAQSLVAHRRRTLCLIVAALECIHVPMGTILGIFTLVVLTRPSVKALFEAGPRPAGPATGR